MASSKGTIFLTGAAGGIGSGFVREFLKTPYATSYHGVYAVHPSAPGNLKQLLNTHAPVGHTYEIIPITLDSLANVRETAAMVNKRVANGSLPPIRALLLVAGGVLKSRHGDGFRFTADGMELMFAVNYLANFLLVLLLLQSMDKEHGRIVYMASTTHNPAYLSNWTNFHKKEHQLLFRKMDVYVDGLEKRVEGEPFAAAIRRYGTSKFLMTLFMYELQRRLIVDPVLSNLSVLALDPGLVGGTDLYFSFPWYMFVLMRFLIIPFQTLWVYFFPNGRFRTPDRTGRDLVFASFDEKSLGRHPKALYLNGTDIADSSPETHDEDKQSKTWEESLEWASIKPNDTILKRWS